MSGLSVWVQFSACIALIGFAGIRLTRYGDVIADKTGLGGSWVGLVLIATVTSLPELASGISAVTLAHAPDIAVGNVLGACVFNLTILAVIDLLQRQDDIYRDADTGHTLAASFTLLMLGMVGFSLLIMGLKPGWRIGHIGFSTPLLLLGYIVAIRSIHLYECAHVAEFTDAEPDRYPHLSLRAAVLRYGAAALVVVAVGIWLPFVGEAIARQMQWSESFVGTLFIALVTTLPELVVTLAAVRIGAIDMAFGNLFGSNLFNLLVLAVDDIFFLKGPLLASASTANVVSAFSVVMMTGIIIAALCYRPKARLFGIIGWPSLALIAVALLNGFTIFSQVE
jgi:cation:H+ antiporter